MNKAVPPIRSKFNNATTAGLLLAALILFSTVCASFFLVHSSKAEQQWVVHTQQVILKLRGLLTSLDDAETAQRGYLLTHDKIFLQPYKGTDNKLNERLESIEELTRDNQEQQDRIPRLRNLIKEKQAFIEQTLALDNAHQFEKALALVKSRRGEKLMSALRTLVDAMSEKERSLLVMRMRRAQETSEWLLLMLTAASTCAMAIFTLLVFMVNRHIRSNQKLQASLEALSLTDELTDLYNRRGFLKMSMPLLRLAAREKKRCTLAFIDMDGLKRINDTLGHEEGSHAIKLIASALCDVFRQTDVLARWGGDEFVVLAYHAEADDQKQITQRLQAKFAEISSERKLPYALSASIGMEELQPDTMTDAARLEAALAAADERMYAQKQQRKSRLGAA